MSDPPLGSDPVRHGVLHATVDMFAESTRTVADLVAAAGSGARDVVPMGMTAAAGRMVMSLQQVLDLVPPLTQELDVLVEEVHAQRLGVQALQAELAALDHQLDVLERSLAPVQAWSHQWRRLRGALADRLGVPQRDVSGGATGDAGGRPGRASTGQFGHRKRARDRGHMTLTDPIAARETL